MVFKLPHEVFLKFFIRLVMRVIDNIVKGGGGRLRGVSGRGANHIENTIE